MIRVLSENEEVEMLIGGEMEGRINVMWVWKEDVGRILLVYAGR